MKTRVLEMTLFFLRFLLGSYKLHCCFESRLQTNSRRPVEAEGTSVFHGVNFSRRVGLRVRRQQEAAAGQSGGRGKLGLPGRVGTRNRAGTGFVYGAGSVAQSGATG